MRLPVMRAHHRVIGLPVDPEFDRHIITTQSRVLPKARGAQPADRRVFGPPQEQTK